VDINGLEIDDLQNIAELGSYLCGNYESTEDGGHRNQNYPLQRGFTGTEVHALSMVSSQGKMDNVHIHNIVSARGDALAIQFFPSNEVTVGSKVVIEDIHAGAALSKSVLGSLTDSMPNKIPRACAVTIWTWTDEESEFYENAISFESKDSVRAKCLTTHTPCSDSDFDGEALEHIASCDATTIVKGEGHSMDNRLLYDTFIRHQSPTHHKLADIIREHKVPDFFPPRAFPEHWTNQPFYVRYTAPIAISTILMMAAVLYKVLSGYLAASPRPDKSSEYEPLVKSDRITLS